MIATASQTTANQTRDAGDLFRNSSARSNRRWPNDEVELFSANEDATKPSDRGYLKSRLITLQSPRASSAGMARSLNTGDADDYPYDQRLSLRKTDGFTTAFCRSDAVPLAPE